MNSNVTGTSDDEEKDGKKARQFSTTFNYIRFKQYKYKYKYIWVDSV